MWEIDFQHVIGVVLLGFIPAFIANKKGRNFFNWWIFGTLVFIVALPAALFIRPMEGTAWYE
ncbi:MAG TPA: hypothetical protein VFM35_08560 [Candidatus Binatia bacterium]|nr:hypothetical protein [Candidatus Binatia bacterium]